MEISIKEIDEIWYSYTPGCLIKAYTLLKIKCEDLIKELRITDELYQNNLRVISEIPECPLHGPCIPHAIDWIREAKKKKKIIVNGSQRDILILFIGWAMSKGRHFYDKKMTIEQIVDEFISTKLSNNNT